MIVRVGGGVLHIERFFLHLVHNYQHHELRDKRFLPDSSTIIANNHCKSNSEHCNWYKVGTQITNWNECIQTPNIFYDPRTEYLYTFICILIFFIFLYEMSLSLGMWPITGPLSIVRMTGNEYGDFIK